MTMAHRSPSRTLHSRAVSRWLLAGFFIAAGANHFRDPAFYLRTIPAWIAWHEQLVDISGVAEVAGGFGVLVPRTRRAAGWSLIALLVAVFPANVYMAVRDADPDRQLVRWLLWARLPAQAVLIAWVWWSTADGDRPTR